VKKDEVGRLGEELAACHLNKLGWQILDRNWRGTRGELDVVAHKDGTLVGVEVKTRSSLRFGEPVLGIDFAKVARLKRLLGQWMAEHRGSAPQFTEVRLDAISVLLPAAPGEFTKIDHIQGIS
jgi:putative endonuclease